MSPQEMKEKGYWAHSQDTDYDEQVAAPTEQHSVPIPGHWEPMRPDEDHRLVDIGTQSSEEYWGDLEGWQVPHSLPDLGFWLLDSVRPCILKLRSCILLWPAAHMHCCTSAVLQLGNTAPCKAMNFWR
jgi:hypothetical protein